MVAGGRSTSTAESFDGARILGNQIIKQEVPQPLSTTEISQYINNHQRYITKAPPPDKPPNGSIILYDTNDVKDLRRDGYKWESEKHNPRKNKNQNFQGYYAREKSNENFQRRLYWTRDMNAPNSNIAVAHYLELQPSRRRRSMTTKATAENGKGHTQDKKRAKVTTEYGTGSSLTTSSNDQANGTENRVHLIHHTPLPPASQEEDDRQPERESGTEPSSRTLNTGSVITSVQDDQQFYHVGFGDSRTGLDYPHNLHNVETGPRSWINHQANTETGTNSWTTNSNDQANGTENRVHLVHPLPPGRYPLTEDFDDLLSLPTLNEQATSGVDDTQNLQTLETGPRSWINHQGDNQYQEQDTYGVDLSSLLGEPIDRLTENIILPMPESTAGSNIVICHIKDFAPPWGYEDTNTKVLITGRFINRNEQGESCQWYCVFGEHAVLAEHESETVLRCYTPLQKAGRVEFYVRTSHNGLTQRSGVMFFDFRQLPKEGIDYHGSYSDTEVSLTGLHHPLPTSSTPPPTIDPPQEQRTSEVVARQVPGQIELLCEAPPDDHKNFHHINVTQLPPRRGRVKNKIFWMIYKRATVLISKLATNCCAGF